MKLILVLLLLLAGCGTRQPAPVTLPKPEPLMTKAITAEQASGCRYIDDLVGASGWYGVFAERGIAKAKASILEKAAEAGADAVVWGPPSLSYGSTSISAKAYRCAT